MNQYGYIYRVTNLVNGRTYIGQKTGEFNVKYYGSGKLIKLAIKKYGKKCFYLEIVQSAFSRDELDNLEKFFIAEERRIKKDTYNIRDGGLGSRFNGVWQNQGKRASLETRQKMSASRSGSKNPFFGADFSGSKNPMFGKRHSPETKSKIGEANRKNFGENHGNFGLKRTASQVEAMRRRALERGSTGPRGAMSSAQKSILSEKAKLRFKEGFKVNFTDEVRRKISEGRKRYWATRKALSP